MVAQFTNEGAAGKVPFQSCQLKTTVTDANELQFNKAEAPIK